MTISHHSDYTLTVHCEFIIQNYIPTIQLQCDMYTLCIQCLAHHFCTNFSQYSHYLMAHNSLCFLFTHTLTSCDATMSYPIAINDIASYNFIINSMKTLQLTKLQFTLYTGLHLLQLYSSCEQMFSYLWLLIM